MALFHSVSAFCNAGFDLLGKTDHLYPSLTSYVGNPLVNLTIMGLIVIGGIGFLTWDDIYTKKLPFSSVLHAKQGDPAYKSVSDFCSGGFLFLPGFRRNAGQGADALRIVSVRDNKNGRI